MTLTDFGSAVRALFYSLWICRVSALSVLGGFALFYLAPQAQAVFLDLHAPAVAFWHWLAFYLSVLLFWMLPVQLSARVMLHAGQDRLDEEDTNAYARLLVHLPWVLAVLCLTSVAVGQHLAMGHLPDERNRRDLLEGVADTQLRYLLGTTVALIVAWLVAWLVLPRIIHRLTIRHGLLDIGVLRLIATLMFGRRATTRGYGANATAAAGEQAGRYSPEQLQSAGATVSLLVILIVSIALVFSSPLQIWASLSRAPMVPILVGAWLPLLTLFAYGAHRFRLPILGAFILLMTIVSNSITGLHDMRVAVQRSATGPLEARQPTLEETLAWWRKANGCPEALRSDCSVRPIIVAAEGGASRAGFFTGSLLAYLEDLSDPTSAARAGGGVTTFSRQLFAISTVSGSTLGAAVFAALREDSQGEAWTRPAPEPANNVLWFRSGKASGVGGSMPEPLPEVASRKDILQQALAGDFLTPVMAALSLDIWVPWHVFFTGGDRTYILERSWEQRFGGDSPGRGRNAKAGFDRPISQLAPEPDRWRPILIFNGTSITTGKRIITSTLYPLLISPDEGKIALEERKTESVFRDSYDAYDLMCVSGAARANGECACVRASPGQLQPLRIKGCDIRLSTAVSNSARFPIISSHGDISTGGRAGGLKVIDRIVDGGYFDYSGIVSAMELRAQISRLDHALSPLVLFVTNDPGFNPQACKDAKPSGEVVDELDVLRAPAAPPDAAIAAQPFSILAYPIETLLNARISRAEQTMANAVLLNRYDNVRRNFHTAPRQLALLRTTGRQPYLNFDIVSVGASCNKDRQIRPVPMNWWLAMPTQAYLDSEICAEHNKSTIAGVLSQLGPQPDEKDLGAHKDRYDRALQRVEQSCTGVAAAAPRTRQTR